jgi:hypothetical protein
MMIHRLHGSLRSLATIVLPFSLTLGLGWLRFKRNCGLRYWQRQQLPGFRAGPRGALWFCQHLAPQHVSDYYHRYQHERIRFGVLWPYSFLRQHSGLQHRCLHRRTYLGISEPCRRGVLWLTTVQLPSGRAGDEGSSFSITPALLRSV